MCPNNLELQEILKLQISEYFIKATDGGYI